MNDLLMIGLALQDIEALKEGIIKSGICKKGKSEPEGPLKNFLCRKKFWLDQTKKD